MFLFLSYYLFTNKISNLETLKCIFTFNNILNVFFFNLWKVNIDLLIICNNCLTYTCLPSSIRLSQLMLEAKRLECEWTFPSSTKYTPNFPANQKGSDSEESLILTLVTHTAWLRRLQKWQVSCPKKNKHQPL